MSAFRIISILFAISVPVFAQKQRELDNGSQFPVAEDIIRLTKTPPIVFSKTSTTGADFMAEKLAWAKRVLVPAMSSELLAVAAPHSIGDCDKMVEIFFGKITDEAVRKTFLELGERWVKKDSPSPILQLFVSDELSKLRNAKNLLPRRNAGNDEKALEKTPAIVRYFSAVRRLGTRTKEAFSREGSLIKPSMPW